MFSACLFYPRLSPIAVPLSPSMLPPSGLLEYLECMHALHGTPRANNALWGYQWGHISQQMIYYLPQDILHVAQKLGISQSMPLTTSMALLILGFLVYWVFKHFLSPWSPIARERMEDKYTKMGTSFSNLKCSPLTRKPSASSAFVLLWEDLPSMKHSVNRWSPGSWCDTSAHTQVRFRFISIRNNS